MKPQRSHLLTAAAIAIAAALLGLGVVALAGGLDRTLTERVHGGEVRVVRVALVDAVLGFDVTPDRLLVDPGTHLVLEVVNDGDEVHDLALEGGARTKRLDPGQSQRLDLGVISASVPSLYCTLPGHKTAGMTLNVEIQDAAADIGPGRPGPGISDTALAPTPNRPQFVRAQQEPSGGQT
jgi:nitrite reductase (NO-forming)